VTVDCAEREIVGRLETVSEPYSVIIGAQTSAWIRLLDVYVLPILL